MVAWPPFIWVVEGTYTLTASLAGFSDTTVEDVTVSEGALELPPVVLQLASFGDTVGNNIVD